MDEKVKLILRHFISTEENYDVFITWKCKTLQNCKWLLGTTLPDNKYYELTYNGIKDELYIDEYDKVNYLSISHPFALRQELEIELSELHDKYTKLDAFITGDKFASLPRVDRELLIRQHKAMEGYYFILQDRIKLANNN